jgi:hypothetical protein
MRNILCILLSLTLACCGQPQSEKNITNIPNKDTHLHQQTITTESPHRHDNRPEKFKLIEENYSRISSIQNWAETDTIFIEEESVEGGEAIFFFKEKKLLKIHKLNFGEMSRWLKEYYFQDGNLSFVVERQYQYNRHFLDPEFDFDKSEIIEDKSYFDDGVLSHQANNQDCGSPFSKEYLLTEQKRITADLKRLMDKRENSR